MPPVRLPAVVNTRLLPPRIPSGKAAKKLATSGFRLRTDKKVMWTGGIVEAPVPEIPKCD